MALTRKFLAAMDIPADKIEEIINAHTETVNGLKDERDNIKKDYDALKAQGNDLDSVKKDLETAQKELDKLKSGDWEKKYNDLKSEYDIFKSDTEAKALNAKKESAYRKLLIDAGVSEKRVDSVIKVSKSKIDAITLDDDGNINDADKETESVKAEWSDFISTQRQEGADVSNPPANNGGEGAKPKSRAAQLVAQYRSEHYGSKED